jgi:NTP pyrophosphatase (non-canonical NTP hydrolase)
MAEDIQSPHGPHYANDPHCRCENCAKIAKAAQSPQGLSAENRALVERVLPENAGWHLSEGLYMTEDVEALLNAARSAPPGMVLDIPAYDAGLLGDGGGGDVEWWQDYIRAELERSHEHYLSHFADLAASPSVKGEDGWRPEVRAFADLMEEKLRANDHKPGWKSDHPEDLLWRLRQETEELAKELAAGSRTSFCAWTARTGSEAVDVANFAMMIADVCGALAPPLPLQEEENK